MEKPRLLLGIKSLPEGCQFVEPERWSEVEHQCGGLACNQKKMVAMELAMPPEIQAKAWELHMEYYGTNAGAFPCSLLEYNEYNSRLALLFGVHCQQSHRDFMEGYYPVDISEHSIGVLTTTKIPGELDDLIVWGGELSRFIGMVNRWKLAFIGENSD